MQDTREKNFTAENIKTHISISVDANYWFNKEGRMFQELADLYNQLFPMELGRDGVDSKKREWLKNTSYRRARELWRAIRENPQSPPGPLTLAAISKAILIGADFDDRRDRHAFFILMQHNEDCRAIYHWAMRDRAVRYNEGDASIELRNLLQALVPSSAEASRLIELWHGESGETTSPYNSLNTKIRNASLTKNNTFFKELFEFAPKLTQSYSNDRASPLFIGDMALYNPGVIEAVCLGYEQPLGFLSQALNQNEMLRVLVQNIVWNNVIVNGKRVAGSFCMKSVYDEPLLDSAAFIAQIEQPKPELNPERCYFRGLSVERDSVSKSNNNEGDDEEYVITLKPSNDAVQVVPSHSDVLAMFGEMANLVRNGFTYFIRYRHAEVLVLIRKIANLDFLEEHKDARALFQELRYRLYHPVTIRAMEAFWHENIDAFICAAGKNDQNLAQLLKHLTNPASLLITLLRQDRSWFVSRVGKLLPVIAKVSGSRAQKDFNYLLNEVVSAEGVDPVVTVSDQFRKRVGQCVENYATQFNDAGEELFSILDEPATRSLSELTAEQVQQCLSVEKQAASECVHSRLEMIIAQDDRLFGQIPEPIALLEEASNLHGDLEESEASEELKHYKSHYPTIWARFRVRTIMANGNLNAYVKGSKAQRSVVAPYEISVREAYVIASHESYWRKIESEKSTLPGKNPVFAIRIEWERHRDRPFDRFLVEKLYSSLSGVKINDGLVVVVSTTTKTEILKLIADLGRGEELFRLHSCGIEAVPQNACRAKAFLAEINTPEKAAQAWEFVQKIDPANIDAEAIFCLMTRDESTEQMRSGKTCFHLAVSLLEKNPIFLHNVILMHTRIVGRLPYGAMDRLSVVVRNWLDNERIVTPVVLQELMRAGLLEIEFSTDITLLRRLMSVEVMPELLIKIKAILLPDGDASPENGHQNEQKPLNGARSDNGYLRDQLSAKDLLRLKEVAPIIFNKLMRKCINLRQLKLCPAINKMTARELSQMSFTGLGYLFANEPQFFYELLLRLPVEKLDPPAGSMGAESEDIFMLNKLKKDNGHHPLLAHMKTIDLLNHENIDLIMRCVNSQNRYLSRLMKEVLVQCINEGEPTLVGDLLRRYLTHPQADERFCRAILEDGPGLRLGVKKVLLETNFISLCLDKDKSGVEFSGEVLKLWSALLSVKSFEEFVGSFQFEGDDKEKLAREKRLSRLYDEYKTTLKTPAKTSGVSLMAKDFSDLFSRSGSQEDVFANGLFEDSYRY